MRSDKTRVRVRVHALAVDWKAWKGNEEERAYVVHRKLAEGKGYGRAEADWRTKRASTRS
jgi:hypothetical protein